MKINDASTVRIGIDLGTTNSSIAVNHGTHIEIIPNIFGDSCTPSVFGIDKGGNPIVGKKAYDRLYKTSSNDELNNYKGEVKRLMGTQDTIPIERAGRRFTPEEISAEILKSLRSDIQRKYADVPLYAAVITVPAMFETMQNEATVRAGKIAGFSHVSLLQEPIAAAIAYGFDANETDTWLVYDFGGGTFDAAVVNSQEGAIDVLGHYGDNFSGGKDIDELLVAEVIRPAILEKHPISQFDRNHYFTAFAKMKALAESAKIELSSMEQVTIEVDNLGVVDDYGNEIYCLLTYTRAEFNRLIAPLVEKTIQAAKKTIEQSAISPTDISKVIMVGGTTLIPYIREQVEQELGIPVDCSVNPLTIVAQGAAIYALGERVPQDIVDAQSDCPDIDAVSAELHYEALTSEEDELITGKVDLDDAAGYTLRIRSDNGFYCSDSIALSNGTFFDTVALEQGKSNVFHIYVNDSEGNDVPIKPNTFTITQGISVGGAPLSHGIGIIYTEADGIHEACDPYFTKSNVPPLCVTRSYKTARTIRRGTTEKLPIKVYEGDSADPELNLILTRLEIKSDILRFDLPEGTDIDITLSINTSRALTVEAYIPDYDLSFDARADTTYQNIDTHSLNAELDKQSKQLEEIKGKIPEDKEQKLKQELANLRTTITERSDTDSKQKAVRDIQRLKEQIHETAASAKPKQLREEAENAITDARELSYGIFDQSIRDRLLHRINLLEADLAAATDLGALQDVLQQAEMLRIKALREYPQFWVDMFERLSSGEFTFTDPRQAEKLISAGRRAINHNELDSLKNSCAELTQLLNSDQSQPLPADLAGITK